jgi:hypothetical protein
MLYDLSRRRIAPLLKFALGGAVVLLLSFWVLFLGGEPVENAKLFYERTFGVQSTRASPFTSYSQLPALAVLHQPLTIATIVLALLVAVVPRKRTMRRLAAFSAALIIAFELILLHWFYVYIVWFKPFVFAALLLATNANTALDGKGATAKQSSATPKMPIESDRSLEWETYGEADSSTYAGQ